MLFRCVTYVRTGIVVRGGRSGRYSHAHALASVPEFRSIHYAIFDAREGNFSCSRARKLAATSSTARARRQRRLNPSLKPNRHPRGRATFDGKLQQRHRPEPSGQQLAASNPAQAGLGQSEKLSAIVEFARKPTRIAVYTGLDLFGDDIATKRTIDLAECARSCLAALEARRAQNDLGASFHPALGRGKSISPRSLASSPQGRSRLCVVNSCRLSSKT